MKPEQNPILQNQLFIDEETLSRCKKIVYNSYKNSESKEAQKEQNIYARTRNKSDSKHITPEALTLEVVDIDNLDEVNETFESVKTTKDLFPVNLNTNVEDSNLLNQRHRLLNALREDHSMGFLNHKIMSQYSELMQNTIMHKLKKTYEPEANVEVSNVEVSNVEVSLNNQIEKLKSCRKHVESAKNYLANNLLKYDYGDLTLRDCVVLIADIDYQLLCLESYRLGDTAPKLKFPIKLFHKEVQTKERDLEKEEEMKKESEIELNKIRVKEEQERKKEEEDRRKEEEEIRLLKERENQIKKEKEAGIIESNKRLRNAKITRNTEKNRRTKNSVFSPGKFATLALQNTRRRLDKYITGKKRGGYFKPSKTKKLKKTTRK